MVSEGLGDAVAQRVKRQRIIHVQDDGAIAFKSERGVLLAEGVDEVGLAMDKEADLGLAHVVGINANGRTAFGAHGEVAGLIPLKRLYDFTNAGGSDGRLQNKLPQFQ